MINKERWHLVSQAPVTFPVAANECPELHEVGVAGPGLQRRKWPPRGSVACPHSYTQEVLELDFRASPQAPWACLVGLCCVGAGLGSEALETKTIQLLSPAPSSGPQSVLKFSHLFCIYKVPLQMSSHWQDTGQRRRLLPVPALCPITLFDTCTHRDNTNFLSLLCISIFLCRLECGLLVTESPIPLQILVERKWCWGRADRGQEVPRWDCTTCLFGQVGSGLDLAREILRRTAWGQRWRGALRAGVPAVRGCRVSCPSWVLSLWQAIYKLKKACRVDTEMEQQGQMLTPEEVVDRIFYLVDENGDGKG